MYIIVVVSNLAKIAYELLKLPSIEYINEAANHRTSIEKIGQLKADKKEKCIFLT